MKPIIVLPPDTMSPEHIKLLRENDLCVVVSKDPAKVKFIDPIPSASCRDKMETAAIGLSRILLSKTWGDYTTSGLIGIETFTKIYIDLLVKGTSLDANIDKREADEEYCFNQAKADELRRIAREEARAQRAEQKAKIEAAAKAKAAEEKK